MLYIGPNGTADRF